MMYTPGGRFSHVHGNVHDFLSIRGGSCGFVPCTRPVFNYVWRVMAGHGVLGLTPSLSANHVDNQRFANDVHGFVHESAQFHPILGVFFVFSGHFAVYMYTINENPRTGESDPARGKSLYHPRDGRNNDGAKIRNYLKMRAIPPIKLASHPRILFRNTKINTKIATATNVAMMRHI